jgi:Na+/proline symporter
MLNMDMQETFTAIWNDQHCRIFEFKDSASRQHFVKQFLSGMFITIVMTGLDQGLMQKNLTCKSLSDAQKDMCSYGIMFIPINFLFLSLGILMVMLYNQNSIALPESGDSLMTGFVAEGMMGNIAIILFSIGIIAPAFSSADSAITALTTSICIDMLDMERQKTNASVNEERVRKLTHAGVIAVFAGLVIIFKHISSGSVIDTIYTIASYTYGPLLGLFAFGLFTKRLPKDKHVPLIALASPFVCYIIDYLSSHHYGYKFGYELLLLNGLFTFTALYLSSMTTSKRTQWKG